MDLSDNLDVEKAGLSLEDAELAIRENVDGERLASFLGESELPQLLARLKGGKKVGSVREKLFLQDVLARVKEIIDLIENEELRQQIMLAVSPETEGRGAHELERGGWRRRGRDDDDRDR